MRQKGNQYFIQNSQQPKHFRGGETKVMKKSLSLLVAIAMVFSMFASVAFAADATTTATEKSTLDKFNEMKAAGIFTGYPGGGAGLENDMTRAEFAKVLAKVADLKDNAAAAKIYTDVAATHWAVGQIGSVTEAKFMNGIAANKFGPTGKVTLEMVAKIATLVAGVSQVDKAVTGTVSPWAKGYVAAAIEAGLLPQVANYQVNATRGILVDVAYDLYTTGNVSVKEAKVIDDMNIEVTFTDGGVVKKTLATALKAGEATKVEVEYNGSKYTVEVTLGAVAIAKAEQTNTREITVNFNRALTATEIAALTYDVKNGLVAYVVTTKWSDDKKSVVLTSTYLPAGEYDVTIKGFAAVKVKVADEIPTKVEIGTTSIQKAGAQDLGVKLFNQFGKAIATPVLSVSVFNGTSGKALTLDADGKLDLSANASAAENVATKVDDSIVITVSHAASGLNATKTFKVVAGSAATSIKLNTIAPLKDKTRITAGETGLILPYELTDQYGTKIKLGAQTSKTLSVTDSNFTISGITFMLSEAGVIGAYKVDADGVLTLDFAKASNLIINAVNPATGATATVTVKIDGKAVVKTLQLNNPGITVAADEEVKIPFAATDNYNAPIAAKDVVLGNPANTVTANAGKVVLNSSINQASGYPKINGKGELLFKFAPSAADSIAYIYAYVDGGLVGSLTLTVKATAAPIKVNGVKDVVSNIVNGVTVKFGKDNVTYTDTYNRTKNVPDFKATDVSVTGTSASLEVDAQGVVTGIKASATVTGETTFSIKYPGTTSPVANPGFEFKVNVVKASDVASYSIKTIGTIYAVAGQTAASTHKVDVALVGKLASGAEVAIDQATSFDFVTSSDASKIGVTGKTIFGLDEGKSTIAAYKGPVKLAEQEVTASKAAPVATTITFNNGEYNVTGTGTITFVVNPTSSPAPAIYVTVKDQYGVEIATTGFLTSSDAKVVTTSGLVATGVAAGQATLTYITTNNVSGTATIVVN